MAVWSARRVEGFTLIELLMTVAIMGVLVLVAVPALQIAQQREREVELRSALIDVRRAIDAYKRAADQGRIAVVVGESGYPHSLQELVSGVVDLQSPTKQQFYFLRSLPKDPMTSSLTDENGGWGLRSYASQPDDPQPGADVFDVYSRSERLGLNGVPYNKW